MLCIHKPHIYGAVDSPVCYRQQTINVLISIRFHYGHCQSGTRSDQFDKLFLHALGGITGTDFAPGRAGPAAQM